MVGRGTLGPGPGAALLLVLVLAGLDVAAPQYMSAGVEWKAGATIPSFAISGRDAVVAVHGQNFCPGGPRCEYCDFDPPQQLCGCEQKKEASLHHTLARRSIAHGHGIRSCTAHGWR